jgi:diaminohydroxyphosphoribosylaminopyrimidine deaminase / 5-amino-6-(5-phosphoribosylamino)uracil reductase
MSVTATDARHMARALELAARGLYTTDPNPRVGCVIVKDGDVVGEGWHQRAGEAHAEVNALSVAGANARGADVYVTLEPCSHTGRTPPCADALIKAGVRRVVMAMRDPNPNVNGKGIDRLRAAGLAIDIGILETQAVALNPGFVCRLQQGRPYVRLKMATTLDGRTAAADGESRWITGEPARRDVQRLRAQSSAILTGIGTVLADDPALTVRDFDIGRQPLRVVVDSALRTPTTAQMLRLPGRTLIATVSEDAVHAGALRNAGAELLQLPGVGKTQRTVDLTALMRALADRQVNDVLVEAGPRLGGALTAQRLVDEFVFYIAPQLLGDGARGMLHLPNVTGIDDRLALDIIDTRAIGDDWRISAKPRYREA